MQTHLAPKTAYACAMGLLLVSSSTIGCRRAEVPAAPRRDLAALDRVLRLMEQRLALMHEVARSKWNASKPVADSLRERELLEDVVKRARAKGLDPDFVHSFFEAQMAAARAVQHADFERWQADKQGPFADATSLPALRERIDGLNADLIDALAALVPSLGDRHVQQALPRRSAEILAGSDLAGVREPAVAPLRR